MTTVATAAFSGIAVEDFSCKLSIIKLPFLLQSKRFHHF